MFVGRQRELTILEKCFSKHAFQMIVMYGRRRVGKTTLLSYFAKDKPTLFFTAQEQSDSDNLKDLARQIAECFGLPQGLTFESWDAVFDYLANLAADDPFLFIFDEFPYAAQANPALPSKLQIAIDHKLKNTRMCLVLCGSNQGFMESNVLGKKSPLHGRRTAQIKVEPFGYRDAACMLGNVSSDDAFRYYACIGGIPYYLAQVDRSLSFNENMLELFFSPEGFLFGEPTSLLRQELREPSLYNSILRAIAHGANKQNEIANKTGIERSHLPRYLRVLIELGIVERVVPFGEDAQRSRKGIYRLRDACYAFWYRFVSPVVGDIESGAGELAFRTVTPETLGEHLGHRFEGVCLEWLLEEALADSLPVDATTVGIWWGTDPNTRSQTDIDVIAANRTSWHAIIGECKYRNSFNETEAVDSLLGKAHLLQGFEVDAYYLFTKKPVSVRNEEQNAEDVRFISLSDLYD
ncbi:ATP-binding protein [Adlercreutzia sp. ZJ304]|uniref:ATP-binding protein n=1 Tax=Adlercreutzia sp. ZJ304 TaxID=2709791 RepID=UPI0013EA55EF|nr:ATP-binding protein [Adlercreutzia sp. ZJ304]